MRPDGRVAAGAQSGLRSLCDRARAHVAVAVPQNESTPVADAQLAIGQPVAQTMTFKGFLGASALVILRRCLILASEVDEPTNVLIGLHRW